MRPRRLDAAVRTAVLAALLAAGASALAGQAAGSPAGPAAAATAAAATAAKAPESEEERAKRRSETVRFGIETEILELLKTLQAEKEGRHHEELLGLLRSSRSARLRAAVLDFYRALAWKGAERDSLALVEDRDLNDQAIVLAALAYLAEIESRKALELAPAILEEEDKRLLPALIRLLGRAGGKAEEELLLGWFDGDGADVNLKLEAIRALGEIGSKAAVKRLSELLEGGEGSKTERIYAAEALGKIGEGSAVPALVKAANGEDPNVRAAALSALAKFEGPEPRNALVEGLRDSFPAARVAAARGAAERKIREAVPNLAYKLRSDPERTVRNESAKALAELGGEEAAEALRGIVDDPKRDAAYRALCFGLLAARFHKGSAAFLRERLAKAGADKDRALYTALAREIAAGMAKEAADLAGILAADKDYLIRLAAVEWARLSGGEGFLAELERLAKEDPQEAVRKRAAESLSRIREGGKP